MAQENTEFKFAKEQFSNYLRKHSQFIQTDHTNLHYLQWGKPTNPTVIWLHGSYSNAFEIASFAKSITDLDYQLIAINYYGHGFSKTPTVPYSSLSLMKDICFLLDNLQLNKCIIGGFSRGAYFANLFYQTYPQRIRGLILEDGGVSPFLDHFVKLSPEDLKRKLCEDLENRPAELFQVYKTQEEAYHVLKPYGEQEKENLYINLSFIMEDSTNFTIYKGIDRLYGMDSYEDFSKLIKGELFSNPFANELMNDSYFRTLKSSTIPILVLEATAENDPFPTTTYYDNLTGENIKHIRFYESQHCIHCQEPKKFTESIQQFLKEYKK